MSRTRNGRLAKERRRERAMLRSAGQPAPAAVKPPAEKTVKGTKEEADRRHTAAKEQRARDAWLDAHFASKAEV